ncbi:hypothetical protein [Neobacillus rhizophilus]|uniref:YqgU-like 6-bladed beta-propeller domain-containing protein n=1 Tax=Neobacillus rhizophilus TaxID=2833579 RepID=A0A942U9Z5_9BACI|nr:hypothetical protein [Neobacillus rhizophilus]MBS4215662.1 hypothetical protein [Neobacillus rhizophilus]MBU8916441.1 hypothetical protein [Bacillus sp. FJAT-29953]
MIQIKESAPRGIAITVFLIVLTLLLGACADHKQIKSKGSAGTEKPKAPNTEKSDQQVIPISIPDGEFYKSFGWLTEEEIVYITNVGQSSNVYRYHLLTGKSELIYKSEFPIVTVQISPSKSFILIHSSPSSYEGLVTIIDTKGNEKLKQSFPSYELSFEWNPYDDSKVLVSAFSEDWDFNVFLLDFKFGEKKELSLPQPFNKWMSANELAFINWDQEHPSLFAPLIKKGLNNGVEKTLFPTVLQFSTFKDLLLKIEINDHSQLARYSFLDKDLQEIYSFSNPLLTKYSDWLVPYFDYNEKEKEFITLNAVKDGEADVYTEGFNLVAYDLKKDSSQIILTGLKNAPIMISPSGKTILYGERFDKIIDLDTKKIFDLVKE